VRILLDVRHRGTLSGSVSYIYNLVPHLLDARRGHEFVLLRYAHQELPRAWHCDSIAIGAQSAAGQAIQDQVSLPRLLQRARVDVYHPFKYLGSMFPSCAQVTTLHSITEPYNGQFPGSISESIYWRHLGRRIIRSSARIIAVSEFLRDFLLAKIGVPEDRITVIPHGIDPRFRRLADAGNSSSGERADGDYLLTVGNLFPVKNFVVAVHVLVALSEQYPTLRLKMAGATDHPYFNEIRAVAEASGVLGRIDFLGFRDATELVALMNHCRILLMPSLTEGCPVTLLEAMACGAPVIGSNRGGIPEIGGSAIVLVDDPHDVATWVARARDLMRDSECRQRLSAASLERAASYTWQRAATETIAVYDTLAQ
jgi:glycosyltransferase involved in cell wall biosynthesis